MVSPRDIDFQISKVLSPIAKERVVEAFTSSGLTLEERFPDCGFVYFPRSAPFTAENPDQGRVFWEYDEGTDEISVGSSWGRPRDAQHLSIQKALALYITFKRQRAT